MIAVCCSWYPTSLGIRVGPSHARVLATQSHERRFELLLTSSPHRRYVDTSPTARRDTYYAITAGPNRLQRIRQLRVTTTANLQGDADGDSETLQHEDKAPRTLPRGDEPSLQKYFPPEKNWTSWNQALILKSGSKNKKNAIAVIYKVSSDLYEKPEVNAVLALKLLSDALQNGDPARGCDRVGLPILLKNITAKQQTWEQAHAADEAQAIHDFTSDLHNKRRQRRFTHTRPTAFESQSPTRLRTRHTSEQTSRGSTRTSRQKHQRHILWR
ncbi:hypothetical protein LTR37_008638 [Vermiconidia calcicola]|uniref:Uncharacterized protein n=1 Tax=Vermiconidia calcicola TaxID=1690605 RepID=A0ACC3NBE1_9PEZI|nr:hypothetical protein LTR37_008638 [Vermiconidia calcicola]